VQIVVQTGGPAAGDGNGESRDAAAAAVNGPALLPTDGKSELKSSRVLAFMSSAAVRLRDYIAGSSGRSPGASVQGIIAGEDDLEVAMLVECGAVRG
jgi:hypothetical protein